MVPRNVFPPDFGIMLICTPPVAHSAELAEVSTAVSSINPSGGWTPMDASAPLNDDCGMPSSAREKSVLVEP